MKNNVVIFIVMSILLISALACGSSSTGGSSTPRPENTQAPHLTNTPANTSTPRPTNTPLPPTPTPDPNHFTAGTYLVGTEIQPGLYRGQAGDGFFGTCYWERLMDLSGSFDSILANDNAYGQFYIQVLTSDAALKTDCNLTYLPTLPTAPTTFPDTVATGTHLVGVDIRPGLYRGQAGQDFGNTCYWARLSDLTGGFDALLANDNANGQFYIDVKATDLALTSRCELEYVASPVAVSTFPQIIQPGTYLVGYDIQPGTYKGQAGSDFSNSCYWARLGNLSGDLYSILANDNANGQFYVQVGASDRALETGCELTLVTTP